MTTSPGNEHRVETRLDIQETIFIEAMPKKVAGTDSGVVMCTSLDLSANGLQVAMDQQLEVGNILRLCVDLPDKEPIFLVAEVKWVRPDVSVGGYRTGFLLFESDDSDITQWKLWVADMLGNN
jgi:hypothetical protein